MSDFKAVESWTEIYRPKSLDEVIGQKAVVAQIRGMIAQKKVHSTMLLSGATGLGKTSLAFIIAYAINELEYGTPCNHIHDFNIGAEGGKDDVEKILKVATYKPAGNFRVIIMDEVHRLSQAAASMLLKPLEKPNGSSVFILATDQPEKLLAPILGRSTQLTLNVLKPEDLVPRLKYICKKEKIDYLNDKILLTISKNANAQPRTAINLLQSTVNAYHGSGKDLNFAFAKALEDFGASVDLLSAKILACIYCKRSKGLINTLAKIKPSEFITLSTYLLFHNKYLIDEQVGAPCWSNEARKKLVESIKNEKLTLQKLIRVHSVLVDLKKQLFTFQVPESDLTLTVLLKLTLSGD